MKITFKNDAAMRDYFIFLYNHRRFTPIHIIKQSHLGRIYDPQINKYVEVCLRKPMKINDYQYNAMLFRKNYPKVGDVLGLAGEAGEVTELYKKFIRGDGDLDKKKLLLELGDVLWYVSAVAHNEGFTLEEVASANLTKLEERHGRT